MKNFFLPTEENAQIPKSLSKKSLLFYSIVLVVVKILAVSYFLFVPTTPITAHQISSSSLVSSINAARSAQGMNTLAPNAQLVEAANNRAIDMINRDYFSHDGCWAAFAAVGYQYQYAGENLAIDFATTQEVHNALMASPSHRANILNGNFTEIGVAAYEGEFEGRTTVIVVELFGTPQAQPAVESETVSEPASPPAEDQPTTTDTTPSYPTSHATEPTTKAYLARPEITFPKNGESYSNINTVTGKADSGVKVTVYDGDKEVGTTTGTGDGKFSVELSEKLAEKKYIIKAQSSNDEGKKSEMSEAVGFTLDRTPPEFREELTFAMIDLDDFTTYFETVVEDSNIDRVTATLNKDEVVTLEESTKEDGKFAGVFNHAVAEDADIVLTAIDKVGNETKIQISRIEVSAATSDTIQRPPIGVTFLAGIREYSDIIIIVIGGLVTLFLILKMAFRKTIQHHQTIINTLLIIILAGVLLVI